MTQTTTMRTVSFVAGRSSRPRLEARFRSATQNEPRIVRSAHFDHKHTARGQKYTRAERGYH